MNARWVAGCIVALGLVVSRVAAAEADAEARFRQLERDIPSLYLLNGLFLTPEQNDKLAGLLKETSDLEARTQDQILAFERQHANDLGRAIERQAQKAAGMSRPPKPDASVRDVVQRVRALHDEQDGKLKELSAKACGMLTPAQREILDGFKPCFIPPRNFRDPVRVGQAKNDTGFGEKAFDKLRAVPESQLGLARQRALEFIVPYLMDKRRIPYSEEARDQVSKEISANLDAALPTIHGLNDVDFELEKSALVEQVMPIEGAVTPVRSDLEETMWKTAVYVLNPGILGVVRGRGTAQAAAAPAYVPPQRGEIKQARDRMATARVLRKLGLTSSQIGQILPVIRGGAAARGKIETEALTLEKQALEPYEQLRKELAAQTPSEDAEEESLKLHRQVKELDEVDLVEALRPYENELDKILTVSQVSVLTESGRDDRGPAPPPSPDPNAARERALQTLDRVRKMNTVEFQNSRQSVAAQFVESCVTEEESVDVISEAERAVQVMEKARGMSGTDYAGRKQDLAVELCPRRSGARPVAYGAKYLRGEPVAVLARSSNLLFTDAAARLLDEMVKRSPGRAGPP
ncbi:MAG: hypothetical protein V1873_06215 [Verrucomicrobiota bacterium]